MTKKTWVSGLTVAIILSLGTAYAQPSKATKGAGDIGSGGVTHTKNPDLRTMACSIKVAQRTITRILSYNLNMGTGGDALPAIQALLEGKPVGKDAMSLVTAACSMCYQHLVDSKKAPESPINDTFRVTFQEKVTHRAVSGDLAKACSAKAMGL